jgi:tryptophan 2,3-dioxygenase
MATAKCEVVMAERNPTAYWDYLKLDRLLELQTGLDETEEAISADELHFIVVHQTFELWFKVILSEIRVACDLLGKDPVPEEDIPRVVHRLDRINEIFRLGVAQWVVMETLPPQDFLAFRDKLVPASGFQSFQMREMEMAMGLSPGEWAPYHDADPLAHIRRLAGKSPAGAYAWGRIEATRNRPSLNEVMRQWLYRTPIRGSGPDDPGDAGVVRSFVKDYLAAVEAHHEETARTMAESEGRPVEEIRPRFTESYEAAELFLTGTDTAEEDRDRTRRIRAALVFIESYRDLPLLAWPRALIDRLVQMEQNMVVWRSRHARMVERTIGRRVGTGGSPGVDYLDTTATYRVFKELWAVRTLLLPRDRLPAFEGRDEYGFAAGGEVSP